MAIMTLAEAKEQLNITSATHDTELQSYIDAVVTIVEDITGVAYSSQTFTEEVGWDGKYDRVFLSHRPVTSITSVTSADTFDNTYDVTRVHIDSFSGEISGLSFNSRVVVVYVAGTSVVPKNVNIAARIILQHLWGTQRGPNGPLASGGLDYPGQPGGGVRYAGFAIPNAALDLLSPRTVIA